MSIYNGADRRVLFFFVGCVVLAIFKSNPRDTTIFLYDFVVNSIVVS